MKALLFALSLTVSVFSFMGCYKRVTTRIPGSYTLTLRPDSTTGQDSYVSKVLDDSADGFINLNFTHELIMARWTFSQFGGDSATQRGYIRFDSLAKIPSTATVLSATLYLYGENPGASLSFPGGNSFYFGSPYPPNPVVIEAVTGGTWQQKTITWNNAPAASPAIQDSIWASTSQYNYNVVVDVTNLVKPMVSSPSTNYGFMLKLVTENIMREMQFASCEASDSTQRPMLVVQYSN